MSQGGKTDSISTRRSLDQGEGTNQVPEKVLWQLLSKDSPLSRLRLAEVTLLSLPWGTVGTSVVRNSISATKERLRLAPDGEQSPHRGMGASWETLQNPAGTAVGS